MSSETDFFVEVVESAADHGRPEGADKDEWREEGELVGCCCCCCAAVSEQAAVTGTVA